MSKKVSCSNWSPCHFHCLMADKNKDWVSRCPRSSWLRERLKEGWWSPGWWYKVWLLDSINIWERKKVIFHLPMWGCHLLVGAERLSMITPDLHATSIPREKCKSPGHDSQDNIIPWRKASPRGQDTPAGLSRHPPKLAPPKHCFLFSIMPQHGACNYIEGAVQRGSFTFQRSFKTPGEARGTL